MTGTGRENISGYVDMVIIVFTFNKILNTLCLEYAGSTLLSSSNLKEEMTQSAS
jgi:hypothetical protein